MPRKVSKTSKSFSTEKHFSAVPPKATAVTTAVTTAAATAVAVKPVTATVTATPALPAVVQAKPATIVDIKPLLVSLHDLDADIACEAATALGKSGSADAVAPLIEIVKNSNHYFHSVVRSAAAMSLGQLSDRRAIEPLLGAVNDPIADPSTEAIRAPSDIGRSASDQQAGGSGPQQRQFLRQQRKACRRAGPGKTRW